MRVDLFDFELPEACIATHPASPRDSSRMLYVPNSTESFGDLSVRDIPSQLRPGDVMVFNDTKVIPARLMGRRGEMGVECLLHKNIGGGEWHCFARPAKRLKEGQIIDFAPDFSAEILGRTDDGQVRIRFLQDDVMALLDKYGELPLPPYMKRSANAADSDTYQTTYAKHAGSVAAPTAGLHFTPELLAAIDATGAKRVHVTLHVGAGTFLPVKVDDTDDHVMHTESATISPEAAEAINSAQRVIAVGTTSMRTLESLATGKGHVQAGTKDTNIFITPGYDFKIVALLMTNFHLPKSTLFMLVSAFAGRERMQAAYAHAIRSGYRFYSYGDACWLEKA